MGSTATGASTLQWGSLTVKNIKKWVGGVKVDIEADDWTAAQEISFWYDGTDWVVQLGGGGGAVTIETQTASTTTNLNFPSVFEIGNNYEILISNIRMSASNIHAFVRFTDDNGGTYESSNYDHQVFRQRGAALTAVVFLSQTTRQIRT